jgi:hypothetical protein
MLSRRFIPQFSVLALLCAGCANNPQWVSAPRSPNPVLLGPVDRIGGHLAEDAIAVAKVDVEIAQRASVSTNGKGNITKASMSADEGALVSDTINGMIGSRSALDVRLEGVDAGGYVMIVSGEGSASKWVRVRGHVAKVRGAR